MKPKPIIIIPAAILIIDELTIFFFSKKYQKSIDLTQKQLFPEAFGDADLFDDINFKDPIDADFYSALDDFKKT